MKFPFIGGAYLGRSVNIDAQTCINLMVEHDASTPDGVALVNTPGYQAYSTTGDYAAEIRGMLYPGFGDLIFAVIGNRFYELSITTLVWTQRNNAFPGATLTATTGPVSMVHSGPITKQILIADGTKLHFYGYNGAPTFYQITVPTALKPNTVAYQDGRAIVDHQNDSGKFYYSNLYDFTQFNAFSFSTAEGSPDTLVGVFVDRRELYLVGYETTEVWYNSSDANNPYQRYQGGFIQAGTNNPYTIQRCDNTIMWLAKNERGANQVVRLADNYQIEVVSTQQIDYLLSTYLDITNAFAITYQLAGHECYVLQFPTTNITWVYDARTREWHQWASGAAGRHKANAIVNVPVTGGGFTSVLALNNTDGKVYVLFVGYPSDDGAVVYRERASHHVNDEQDRVRFSTFQIDIEEATAGGTSGAEVISFVSAGVAPGATQLTLNAGDLAFAIAGHTLALVMDNGTIHLATITNTATNPVTFTEPTITGAGIANAVIIYEDDRLYVEWSKDGGQTWSAVQTLHMGVDLTIAGQITADMERQMNARRLIIRKPGVARQWTLRVKTANKCKVVIKGVWAGVYGGQTAENTVRTKQSAAG